MVELEPTEEGQTNLVAKVTDFGFTKVIDPIKKERQSLGTPLYMAPELTKLEKYGIEVDIWALGVMIHNILTGKAPFMASNKAELFEKISNQELDLEPFNRFRN